MLGIEQKKMNIPLQGKKFTLSNPAAGTIEVLLLLLFSTEMHVYHFGTTFCRVCTHIYPTFACLQQRIDIGVKRTA